MQSREKIFLEPHAAKVHNTGKRRGVLIAFEGVDGTGKSTQARLLAEALKADGRSVILTREPTDGPFGLKIRKLFISRETVSRDEELELFLADRREHVAEVIAPALAQGDIVITDRYYLSTVAYQGAAGLDPVEILSRNQEFAPYPDLVVLLVLPIAKGLERIQVQRGESLNAFEQQASLERVAQIFDCMSGELIRRVDAARSPALVHQEIFSQTMSVLEKLGQS